MFNSSSTNALVRNQVKTNDYVDNQVFVSSYLNSIEKGLETLHISDFSLWPEDVPGIVESLRRHNIHHVTYAGHSSAAMSILWEFKKAGGVLIMDSIRTGERFPDFDSEDYRMVDEYKPGFRIMF